MGSPCLHARFGQNTPLERTLQAVEAGVDDVSFFNPYLHNTGDCGLNALRQEKIRVGPLPRAIFELMGSTG